MTDFLKKKFSINEGIISFVVQDESTKKVTDFYKESQGSSVAPFIYTIF